MSRLLPFQAGGLLLAPMEGVTDAAMRELLTEQGGISAAFTDFLRVSVHALPSKVVRRHFSELEYGCRTRSGVPVFLQLLGGDPERLAETAHHAIQAGALGIDLNFGCPAPTVNRHDGGATLLKYPDRIFKIVRAVRDAVPARYPVSAKLRLGWDSVEPVIQNARSAEEAGASWVTVHARTKVDGYKPPAKWECLRELRRQLSVPLIANGDIFSVADLERCRHQTGCEYFMVGRGLLADPLLGMKAKGWMGSVDWEGIFSRFAEISRRYDYTDQGTLNRLKQWCRMASVLGTFCEFDRIKSTQTLSEFFKKLKASHGLEFAQDLLSFERSAAAV